MSTRRSRSRPFASRPLAVTAGVVLLVPLALTTPVHAADPVPVQVVPPTGVVLGGDPFGLDMSADGRWIAHTGRTGGTYGLYATDRTTGVTTTLVVGSATPLGALSISGDGGRIAYVVGRTGDAFDGDAQVRVVDRATGVGRLVSTTPGGDVGNGTSWSPDISRDGSVVAFTTRATNLAAGTEGPGSDVVVKVLATGVVERVSGAAGASSTTSSRSPSTSADGDRVAFATDQQLVATDTDPYDDVVVRTRSAGAYALASLSVAAAASAPSLSEDGGTVAYLVADGGFPELPLSAVHVTTLASGETVRAGVDGAGTLSTPGTPPVLSGDGRSVLFTALASGAGRRAVEAFVRDLARGTTRWVSTAGPSTSFHASGVAVSATGRHVLFLAGSTDWATAWTTDLGEPEPGPEPSPVNVSPPTLAKARAASGPSYALRATPGRWTGVPGATYSYQWLRNGRPVAGGGSVSYTVKASDFGKRLAVRESVVVDGRLVGTAQSEPMIVARASSATEVRVARSGRHGRSVTLDVALAHTPGVRPQGALVVQSGLRFRVVPVDADGSTRVRLTLRPGRHVVRVGHLPTAYVEPAPVKRMTLRVTR